ncbi:arrestin domain-containing protein 1-like [Sardina pilchardus]|uniref:arrestin domain-containing protein 1-like n=1 Tax=Sardina pilchardus TaxID=27697 RepID=UPI002E13DB9E
MATGKLPMEKSKDEGKLNISITDHGAVWSPGETITGIVEIKNVEPIPSKAIKVNCRGYCGVSPRESSKLRKLQDPSWEVEEQYFNNSISMADKGILKNGSHTFPFTFVVPANIPSTYYGKYGRIIFEIRAFVDLPHFSNGLKAKRDFYIQKPLNLNTVPNIQDISSSSVTKDFTYMLVKNGTIVLKATSDMRGYKPCQIIKLETEIENRSGTSTSKVVASFIQKVTYKTKRPIHDLRTVAKVVGTSVKAKKEAKWKEQIAVPPTAHSTLGGCELINIEYYIQVSLKFPNVLLTLPIFIGGVAVDATHHSDSASSAPPAGQEHKPLEEGMSQAEEIVTKSHSQPPGDVSPHAFYRIHLLQSFGSPETFIAPFFDKGE